MKNNKYIQTEIENLSAYLDHELTQAEEAQLRSRLAQDNKLRETLEDLRLTRYTLRNTPKVRRQRSFVLTPEMVRQQRSAWRVFNFSRTMAVAASVLFALVVGSEMLSGISGGMLAAAPQSDVAMNVAVEEPAEEPMMMEAPAEESAADDSAMSALADEGEADDSMNAEMAPMPTETLAPFPTQAEGVLPTDLPGGGGGLPPTETEPSVMPEEAPVPTEAASSEYAGKDGEMGDSALRTTGEQAADEITGMENTVPEMPPPAEPSIQPIRLVQGGLLLVALLGTGLAYIFRRRVS